ncbi:MAG: hemerythrin domain-containing protein [Thermoplasmata archaeon]|jgi:hemerythrin-like domain-containing protein
MTNREARAGTSTEFHVSKHGLGKDISMRALRDDMAAGTSILGPTERLEWEHHCIQIVVGAMAPLAETLEKGGKVDVGTLRGIVEFMRTFADKCHHGKEEKHLFALLEQKGVPVHGCPLGILLLEHQKGRALVAKLAELTESYSNGNPAASEELVKCLHELMHLYPNHIWKEDYLAFPMTNKIVTPEEQRELNRNFEDVDKSIGTNVHDQFLQSAQKLEKDARTTTAV